MKKAFWILIIIAALLSTGASNQPVDTIQLTIINKSGMDIAVQLRNKQVECATCLDKTASLFYYLPVSEGDRHHPNAKMFEIEKENYGMQVYYIETWDPVYGFKCQTPKPNSLVARRNIRVTILPCDQTPGNVGERHYRKFLPFPVKSNAYFYDTYWATRLIY